MSMFFNNSGVFWECMEIGYSFVLNMSKQRSLSKGESNVIR